MTTAKRIAKRTLRIGKALVLCCVGLFIFPSAVAILMALLGVSGRPLGLSALAAVMAVFVFAGCYACSIGTPEIKAWLRTPNGRTALRGVAGLFAIGVASWVLWSVIGLGARFPAAGLALPVFGFLAYIVWRIWKERGFGPPQKPPAA